FSLQAYAVLDILPRNLCFVLFADPRFFFFFFFQAEDGIRDYKVTGVQTCALPISFRDEFPGRAEMIAYCKKHRIPVEASLKKPRSEERRVGKECRSRWAREH